MRGACAGGSSKLQKGLNSRMSKCSMSYMGKGLNVSSVFAEIMPRILLSLFFVICGYPQREGGERELKVTYVLKGKKINFNIIHHLCI